MFFYLFICFILFYFKASEFIVPIAYIAASRTSATSHRNNGATNLYNDVDVTLLQSFRSPIAKLSGEELKLKSGEAHRITGFGAKGTTRIANIT